MGRRVGFWTDERILTALDLFDNEGLLMREIAERFGTTKGSVIGTLDRVRKADAAIPDLCRRKKNKDGGMPPKWWER